MESQIADARVEAMDDGGMGSVHFLSPVNARQVFGRQVNEADFRDEDGVPVSASLNLDQNGALFELDLFKADSSPVRRLPAAAALTFAARALA